MDLADAVRAALRCDQSAISDWALGYLLGVLVQDSPDGLGASHRPWGLALLLMIGTAMFCVRHSMARSFLLVRAFISLSHSCRR